MKQDEIDRLALKLLRQAQGYGWHAKALACDYAETALEANGVPHNQAHKAVQRAWSEHFDVAGPV